MSEWCGVVCVRCRRAARREGEIQDDQRGPRLHVHRTRRLLGGPRTAHTARRFTHLLSNNFLLYPPISQSNSRLISALAIFVSDSLCQRSSAIAYFVYGLQKGEPFCLLYALLYWYSIKLLRLHFFSNYGRLVLLACRYFPHSICCNVCRQLWYFLLFLLTCLWPTNKWLFVLDYCL